MLIICPKCFAQYAISDEIRVKKGQKFHCSACQNYFVLKQNDDLTDDESDVIPTVSSVMQAAQQPMTPEIGIPVPTVETTDMNNPAQEVVPEKQEQVIDNSAITPVFEPVSSSETLLEQPVPTRSLPPLSDILPESVSPVEEALSALARETPRSSLRIDSLPEEFKPVQKKSGNTSFLSTLFWLAIAGGICYSAYLQKDFFIEKIDSFIVTQLDKQEARKTSEVNDIKAVETEKKIASEKPEVSLKDKTPVVRKQVVSGEEVKTVRGAPLSETKETEQLKGNQSETRKVAEAKTKTVIPEKTPVGLIEIANNTEPLPQPVKEKPSVVSTTEKVSPQQKNVSGVLKQESVSVSPETAVLSGQIEELSLLGSPSDALPKLSGDSKEETALTNGSKSVGEKAVISESFAPLAEQETLSPAEIAQVLKIQNVSYLIAPNEAGVHRIMIRGEIVNTELKTLVIPEMKAVVYNEEDEVVARKRIVLSQAQIEGNSRQPFFSSVVPAPAQVSHVEVVFDE